MTVLALLGWVLIASGAVCAAAAHAVDRKLQEFRLAGVAGSAYWFVPVRIRRDLYQPEAHYLVDRAWRLIVGMYGLAGLGMFLVVVGA